MALCPRWPCSQSRDGRSLAVPLPMLSGCGDGNPPLFRPLSNGGVLVPAADLVTKRLAGASNYHVLHSFGKRSDGITPLGACSQRGAFYTELRKRRRVLRPKNGSLWGHRLQRNYYGLGKGALQLRRRLRWSTVPVASLISTSTAGFSARRAAAPIMPVRSSASRLASSISYTASIVALLRRRACFS